MLPLFHLSALESQILEADYWRVLDVWISRDSWVGYFLFRLERAEMIIGVIPPIMAVIDPASITYFIEHCKIISSTGILNRLD
jgi:hypothetical protein